MNPKTSAFIAVLLLGSAGAGQANAIVCSCATVHHPVVYHHVRHAHAHAVYGHPYGYYGSYGGYYGAPYLPPPPPVYYETYYAPPPVYYTAPAYYGYAAPVTFGLVVGGFGHHHGWGGHGGFHGH